MASRTNHSVDRALSLLRLLAHAHRPVRFADIQAQSGIPKGTLHSLLASLEAAEFARRSAQGYEIGLAAFEVGTAVRVPASLRAAVAPLLDEQSSLGEACHFGMLDGGDVVYLDRRDYSHDALHYTLPVGSRKPAYSTALGKAMLALQPDAEIEALYPGRLAVLTPRTLTSRADLLAVLAGIRERGYATESEESTPGVCCIGVAGRLRDVSYGLSITVPVVRMREPELAAKFLPVLAAVLRRLTGALTTAEWFEPGAITLVQEGLAREGPRLPRKDLRWPPTEMETVPHPRARSVMRIEGGDRADHR
jgi:DNA-binding IclR family transcriptional regulator